MVCFADIGNLLNPIYCRNINIFRFLRKAILNAGVLQKWISKNIPCIFSPIFNCFSPRKLELSQLT